MADRFAKKNTDLDDPADHAFEISPSDSTTFSQPTRALYVGGEGNVKVMMAGSGNNVVLFSGVTAGTVLPIRVQRVYSGNTTATLIVGLY